jgi:hypothetical protein
MNKRLACTSIPFVFVLLALACLAVSALKGISILVTLSTTFIALSLVSTLILFIINTRAHERAMAKLYAEKRESDTMHFERMAELFASRSAR